MKILPLIISLFFIAAPALAGDLCQLSRKLLNMTTAEATTYFKDSMRGWRIRGSGTVYDVRKRGYGHIIIVRCNNTDAFADLETTYSVKNLRKGQRIQWSGESKSFRIGRYVNDKSKQYINVTVKDSSFR